MNDIDLKTEKQALAIPMDGLQELYAPLPFNQKIFLTTLPIVGMYYVEEIHERVRGIEEGSILNLVREPENPYDERAILVLNEREEKLGYIPRNRNEILANLMDAGKELVAETEVICTPPYDKTEEIPEIQINIYMVE